jgi:hypothetical protein
MYNFILIFVCLLNCIAKSKTISNFYFLYVLKQKLFIFMSSCISTLFT